MSKSLKIFLFKKDYYFLPFQREKKPHSDKYPVEWFQTSVYLLHTFFKWTFFEFLIITPIQLPPRIREVHLWFTLRLSRHIFMFDLWTRCYQWRLQAAAILADGNKLVLSTKPFEENNSLTMAVPFSNTKLRVPKGFQNILEGLARECLRSQPENIYEFGAKYFQQLIQVRERK